MKMNALVLAGGIITEDDPLFSEVENGWRCLLDIHGKPMAQWVLDALSESEAIQEIYIIGLPPQENLTSPKPLHFLSESGGLFKNIRAGVLAATEEASAPRKVCLASGDIPAVRPEMVDWLANQVSQNPGAWIYYNVIPQAVMDARYPSAKRTFVHFKDVDVCGGDLNVVDRDLFAKESPLWQKLTHARKNPIKQMSLLGIHNLILIALRLLTLEKAVQRVCKKLQIKGSALICPFAEMGMDADKPYQLDILRKDLGDQV